MLKLIILLLMMPIVAGMGSTSDVSYDEDQLEFLKNLTFTDLEGDEQSLEMFEDKVVLIDVWETWCTPCLMSFPHLDELQETFEDDFVLLALNPLMMDDKETVEQFIDEHDYNFVYGYNEEIAEKLGISSIPYKIYMGPNGEFIETKIGNQGPDADYETTREIIEEYGK